MCEALHRVLGWSDGGTCTSTVRPGMIISLQIHWTAMAAARPHASARGQSVGWCNDLCCWSMVSPRKAGMTAAWWQPWHRSILGAGGKKRLGGREGQPRLQPGGGCWPLETHLADSFDHARQRLRWPRCSRFPNCWGTSSGGEIRGRSCMVETGQQRDGEASLRTAAFCLASPGVSHAAPTHAVSSHSPGVTADPLASPSTCGSQEAQQAPRKVLRHAPGFTSLSSARLSSPWSV